MANFLQSLDELLNSNKVGGNSLNQLPENLGISSEKSAKAQGKEYKDYSRLHLDDLSRQLNLDKFGF